MQSDDDALSCSSILSSHLGLKYGEYGCTLLGNRIVSKLSLQKELSPSKKRSLLSNNELLLISLSRSSNVKKDWNYMEWEC